MSDAARAADALATLVALVTRGIGTDVAGLTATQRLALFEIATAGPLRLNELAERMRVSDATASRSLDALVAAGLARRERNRSDRRAIRVELTIRGARRVAERRARTAAVLEPALERFEPTERDELFRLLEDLNTALAGLADDEDGSGLLFAGR